VSITVRTFRPLNHSAWKRRDWTALDQEAAPEDNGHHFWIIDVDPHESNKIAKVKVQIQTQGSNGSWNVAGSRTVSIAE
jgi:hypothetical protein